jgi:hypothetical protein
VSPTTGKLHRRRATGWIRDAEVEQLRTASGQDDIARLQGPIAILTAIDEELQGRVYLSREVTR